MWRMIVLAMMTMAIALGCSTQGFSTPSISLGLPLDCKLGQGCFILQYPDRDPSPNAVDYGCGRMTYDNHNGTDFAIRDEALMKKGVPVIASAPGTVLRVRDGVVDRRVQSEQDEKAVQGNECGNGLVIDHGNGWELQYCHLRQNSILVKPNDRVTAGQVLGLIGESGLASFPHVHLSVRYQGQEIDPSVGVTSDTGCEVKPNPLWAQPLAYKPTGLIRSGISPTPPTLEQLWQGAYQTHQLSSQNAALVFWVHLYGVLAGDKESFEIRDPAGQVIVMDQRTSDRPNRVAMGFVGKKFTPGTLKPGNWTGIYTLQRQNETIISVNLPFEITAT